MKLRSVRGTHDIFGEEIDKFNRISNIVSKNANLKEYKEIQTPIFEFSDLFTKPLGEHSDVVLKEMYSFEDRNNEFLTLRPEYTTPMIRAAITNNLLNDLPLKIFGIGPMFRRERPQKGRYRQFNQAGVEILGYKEGMAEFEMISMVCSINHRLKIEKPTIKINHLGDNETKKNFCDALIKYLKPIKSQLDEKDLSKLEKNPLRILDSKSAQTIELLKDGPKISEFLQESSLKIMDLIVDTFSDECEIQIDHNLVRGLDYYTGFVFEAISSNLGAQDAYLGGGRYDNLCKQLGGKDLPAIGMAIGIERLSLLSNVLEEYKTSVSLIIISSNMEPKAYKIAHNIRSLNNNINVDVQLSDGSLKSKLRRANKDNSSYAIIIGDEELGSDSVIVKSLSDDDSEQTIMKMNDFNNFIKNLK